MHSTGEHVHILRNAVDKLARAYPLKWLHWNNFLRSNAVKLQLCWTWGKCGTNGTILTFLLLENWLINSKSG